MSRPAAPWGENTGLPARAVEVQQVTSPGGITAWLVEDHSNPILSLDMAFAGGAALVATVGPREAWAEQFGALSITSVWAAPAVAQRPGMYARSEYIIVSLIRCSLDAPRKQLRRSLRCTMSTV